MDEAGLMPGDVRVSRGRWIDLVHIGTEMSAPVAEFRRRIPQIEAFLGVSGIRLTCRKSRIILEVPKPFPEMTLGELGYEGRDLCIGATRDFKPLTVDVRYGGLLVVGDHGTGKTAFQKQCADRLKGRFDVTEQDEDGILSLAGRLASPCGSGADTLLVAGDYDRMTAKARKALLRIALKGHLYNIHTIASTSTASQIDALTMCAFRNVVCFRIASGEGPKCTVLPDDAALLGEGGDGLLVSTLMDITRFHTIK